MRKQEMRKIALGAVRSQARRQGQNPASMSAADALAVLDDMYRMDPALIASMWYGEASENQLKLFEQEWRQ